MADPWLAGRQALKLGLDLKGGVHLVLRVNTDDALRISTEGTSEQLRESLRTAGVNVSSITVTAPTAFRVEGVPPDREQDFRRITDEQIPTEYQRNGGVSGPTTSRCRQHPAQHARAGDGAGASIRSSAASTSWACGAEHRASGVRRHLPDHGGVAGRDRGGAGERDHPQHVDPRVQAGRGRSGRTREALLQTRTASCRRTWKFIQARPAEPAASSLFLVRKVAAVTGKDLRNAQPSLDENSQPAVSFTLNPDGARKFGTFTGNNIGRCSGSCSTTGCSRTRPSTAASPTTAGSRVLHDRARE
jgi:preprotein translocase subunit SecD